VHILQFVTEGLGDSSYLLLSGGQAAVIDPQRDIRPYLQAAAEHGATIRYAVETHVHNDYVSGARELAARGAEIVAPRDARFAFPHRPVDDAGEIEIGQAKLRAVKAPGHTYEHTAYLAVDERGAIAGAFTGGALLVGATGRTDLLGPDHTEELTRLQFESVRRLAAFVPGDTPVLPTHGAGSFCSSGQGGERRSQMSTERDTNPALVVESYEAFRAQQLGTPPPTPAYYRHMAPINRAGPAVHGEPPRPALLEPGDLKRLAAAGVPILDVRPRDAFVEAHVPGSLELEQSDSQVAYVSWLVPFNSALALVAADAAQAETVTTDLFRIGYEQVRGYLTFEAWRAAGRPVEGLETVETGRALAILQRGEMPVLDVRFRAEHESTPLEGALRRPVDQLRAWAGDVGPGPVLVLCESGQRSTMAASFLRARGTKAIALDHGGATELRARMGAETAS
jgi:glyoxylase-like metal-dependent hydrolase (beta-lactamase superfamily II)/rhodanese-related sulfurtransferase